MNDITYVGLDVHKAAVCLAIAESGRGGEVREVGVFENRPDVLRKMVARLGKQRRAAHRCAARPLTHHPHILTMNGDSYRLKQSAGRRRAATSTNAAGQNQAIAETDNQVDAPAVDPAIV
jgi:hypothetical protein